MPENEAMKLLVERPHCQSENMSPGYLIAVTEGAPGVDDLFPGLVCVE